MIISEKSARRFAQFARINSWLFDGNEIRLIYCGDIKDNSHTVLARFDINPRTRLRLEERNKGLRGMLPTLDKGQLILERDNRSPTLTEQKVAELALASYLFGAKCRLDGAKK